MEFVAIGEAVGQINDGSLITFSGMELNRAPMALIYEIARQKKKNLSTVSIPNPMATDVLIKEGCVKKAVFGFNGFSFEDGFFIAPNWKRAVEKNAIEWRETDILEIVLALKAASLGLKEITLPNFINTDYLKFNEYRKGKSQNEIIIDAVSPDFALIHAQYADRDGNVLIEDPLIDRLISDASENVIISAEKIVDSIKNPTISKNKKGDIVHIEKGASPTSCFGFYNYDCAAIRQYLQIDERKNTGIKSVIKNRNADYLVSAIAGMIKDGSSVATGVASPLPVISVLLAKRLGKKFDYFNCGSGALNPDIEDAVYSSVTINALNKKESFVTLLETWEYALKGKFDTMFFGAVQIAGNGDVNTTCIGNYKNPKVKLPGPAGAVALRSLCKNPVIVIPNHTKRTFVEKVDFVTSSTDKDTIVATNLGILKLGKNPGILFYYSCSSVKEILENTGFRLDYGNAQMMEVPKESIRLIEEIDKGNVRYI